ncbi:MAG: putative metal-binding motif-containing protein, partial [Myxococcales bacterium]|nr:putative metal-binding motif-containing protein [Myxococcales bacterium]
MIPSIVALLALPAAYAVPVNTPAQLQQVLDQACASTAPSFSIELPSVLELDPSEVGVYPNPAASCQANPPDLVIQPINDSAKLRLQAQAVPGSFTLLTFLGGVNVDIRNIHFDGPNPGDPGTEDPDEPATRPGESYTPECALYGGSVRGIVMDSEGSATRGTLTVQDSLFTCLDAEADGFYPGSGGAIYAIDAFVVIDNTDFEFNSAYQDGGAIRVTGTQPSAAQPWGLDISHSRFERNDALLGGAVSNNWAGMDTRVTRARFILNLGYLGAGGLDLKDQVDLEFMRNEFDRQNPANLDAVQEGGALRVDSTSYYRNNPSATGGELLFRNNIVCGSWAGRGGGVFVDSVPTITIEGSVFAENGGLQYGGGLFLTNTEDNVEQPNITVIHNTFVGNEAGKTPEWITPRYIYSYGGGGAASFFGVNAEFRNNVVSNSIFGGGVFVEYVPFSTNGFVLGDPLVFYNNLFFENDDGANPQSHLTGDAAQLAVHPSNVLNVDPELSYLGLGEYDCVPEAFYPLYTSPVVDAGGGPVVNGVPTSCEDWADTSIPQDFVTDVALTGDTCDIGAFGGRHGLWIKDSDLDGFANIFDCDDNDEDINPGVQEVCDFADNDCNGLVDDGIQSVWYPDADGDGLGDAQAAPLYSCDTQIGMVAAIDGIALNTDCDDADPNTYPGAVELCDGKDNNCDRVVDENLTFTQWYEDLDGDGYGAAGGRYECA